MANRIAVQIDGSISRLRSGVPVIPVVAHGAHHAVTVLARGAVLAEGTYEQVSGNPAVLEAYVGIADE
jgi:ABC-type uncharacterized transport system ATPase subunit